MRFVLKDVPGDDGYSWRHVCGRLKRLDFCCGILAGIVSMRKLGLAHFYVLCMIPEEFVQVPQKLPFHVQKL
jgi:hypothetical protein